MTRSRWAALVAVGALVVAAVVVGVTRGPRGTSGVAAAVSAGLRPLQAQAALAPCPTGLGPDLPDVTLACLGGGPAVRLRSVGSGVPTLVNIYASWCGPCQDEMPLLRQFHEMAGAKVRLVGLTTEDEPRLSLEFAKSFQQHWPALVDQDKLVLPRYGPGPPVTLFLDASGRLVFTHLKAYPSLAALRADVRTHLGVTV